MVEYSTVLQFIQATGIIVGVAYYIINIQNNQRNQELTLETRQAQVFLQFWNRTGNEKFVKSVNELMKWDLADYDKVVQVYDPDNNTDFWVTFMEVENVLETVGLLVSRGLIDSTYISDMMSGTTLGTWEHIKPFVYEYRERRKDPYFCEWAEYIYNVVSKIEKKPGYKR